MVGMCQRNTLGVDVPTREPLAGIALSPHRRKTKTKPMKTVEMDC
jgi:hypothetical protein